MIMAQLAVLRLLTDACAAATWMRHLPGASGDPVGRLTARTKECGNECHRCSSTHSAAAAHQVARACRRPTNAAAARLPPLGPPHQANRRPPSSAGGHLGNTRLYRLINTTSSARKWPSNTHFMWPCVPRLSCRVMSERQRDKDRDTKTERQTETDRDRQTERSKES